MQIRALTVDLLVQFFQAPMPSRAPGKGESPRVSRNAEGPCRVCAVCAVFFWGEGEG